MAECPPDNLVEPAELTDYNVPRAFLESFDSGATEITTACVSVTGEALYLMRNAVRPPLTAWGAEVKTHAAAMVYAILKRGKGATPRGAGMGDENIFLAEEAARAFFRGIGEGGKPDNMTDAAAASTGPIFSAYPVSDPQRDW